MGWHLDHDSWSWHWLLNTADREVPVILFKIVVLSEFIDTSNLKYSSVSGQGFTILDLIASQVAISNKLLPWLVHVERLRQSLPSEVYRERISTIVREMHLPNLDGVISEEVMPLELQITTFSVESENLSIMVQELFL